MNDDRNRELSTEEKSVLRLLELEGHAQGRAIKTARFGGSGTPTMVDTALDALEKLGFIEHYGPKPRHQRSWRLTGTGKARAHFVQVLDFNELSSFRSPGRSADESPVLHVYRGEMPNYRETDKRVVTRGLEVRLLGIHVVGVSGFDDFANLAVYELLEQAGVRPWQIRATE